MEELINHLKQKIRQGYTVSQIEYSLKAKGYKKKEIQIIIDKVVSAQEYRIQTKALKHVEKLLIPILVVLGMSFLFFAGYVAYNLETVFWEKNYEEFTVRGNSMLPTLHDGQQVFLDREKYQKSSPERGDLIALKLQTQQKPFVKRVIALEGDTLEFRVGKIYVNQKELKEEYLHDQKIALPSNLDVLLIPLSSSNNIVPRNTVFVLGDNRVDSKDSTKFGFLPEEYIIGKVILKK